MVISGTPQAPPDGDKPRGMATPPQKPAEAVWGSAGQNLPLVELAVLHDLEDQLGRADLAINFVKDYSALWEQRERRLTSSLADEDRVAALDAVISLKVSSSMIGARRLAGLAQALESAVREDDFSGGGVVLTLISDQGRATVNELQIQYLQRRG